MSIRLTEKGRNALDAAGDALAVILGTAAWIVLYFALYAVR